MKEKFYSLIVKEYVYNHLEDSDYQNFAKVVSSTNLIEKSMINRLLF